MTNKLFVMLYLLIYNKLQCYNKFLAHENILKLAHKNVLKMC